MDRATRINRTIGQDIGANATQVAAAIRLLDEGATVPFVARYRKEATGGLDDAQLRLLADRLGYLRDMDDRRDAILKSIREQDKLTEALARAIDAATTKVELEDIYLPYKPKRRTKAMIARENGLQPLRDAIMADRKRDPEELAKSYLSEAVPEVKEALNGARDILTEELSETADLLGDLRGYLRREALVTAKVVPGQEEAGAKFSDYFNHSEKWSTMPSHRALALLRAMKEGVIRFDIGPDKEVGEPRCESMVAARLQPSGDGPGDRWLREVASWAWRVKLSTTMMTELVAELRARAQQGDVGAQAEITALVAALPSSQGCAPEVVEPEPEPTMPIPLENPANPNQG